MSNQEEAYPLLQQINGPADLKPLEPRQLIQLSHELRQFIIDIVSSNPGHFGASLGVVELTVALHRVFNSPFDKLIWDVGHQAYGHKILTGRRDQFHTNRKYKGISGFPKPSESEHDAFGVGHSSTSISAALGMTVGHEHTGEQERQVVAVIGDGALSGGMAFEALNNAGHEKKNMLVILNDNNMAIDPSVGAMKEYLLDITTSRAYNKVRTDVWNLMGYLNKLNPNARHYVQKIESAMKSIVLKQSNLFESFNFRYFGPVDGHDVLHLTTALEDLKDIPGPKLLHILTRKGKGFPQAELNQTIFHSPSGKFDRKTGEFLVKKSDKPQPPRFQDVFGETLLELAEGNKKIVGITPAMPSGSSLKVMMEKIPDRTFDVGIAEQHAVTFSAGLAAAGMTPYCNIYSSFMQRAYDQVIHDVAIQNLPVVFCLDRAGLVGADGATHHGAYDLAYMRCIPNLTIASPLNEIELRNLMYSAQQHGGPYVIRYPRGRGVTVDWKKPFSAIETGKGQILRDGEDLAILSIGPVGNTVAEAIDELEARHLSIAHIDLRFLKPLDTELLKKVFSGFKKIITVEDGSIAGGMGSAVLEFMSTHNYQAVVKRLGIPDRFVDQGTPEELQRECGFDKEGIIKSVCSMVDSKYLFRAM